MENEAFAKKMRRVAGPVGIFAGLAYIGIGFTSTPPERWVHLCIGSVFLVIGIFHFRESLKK